jgi:hypothetical protein
MTEVFMKRELLGGEVRQSSLTEFISINDLLIIGNKWRAMNNLKLFDYNSWYNSSATKDFLDSMMSQYGEVMKSKKGKTGERWAHPFIAIDIALQINPQLKVEIYKWIYDGLLKYRNTSGDSYKKMCGELFDNCQTKTKFHIDIIGIAKEIQDACCVYDWQSATEFQLKLRDKIHENIYLLAGVLRNNKQAVRIGIEKALLDFKQIN